MFVFLLIICLIVYLLIKKTYTKDSYTSAQPPPPLSNQVSPNIVYSYGSQIPYPTPYTHPILGVDCADDSCIDYFPYGRFNPIYNGSLQYAGYGYYGGHGSGHGSGHRGGHRGGHGSKH